MTYLFKESYDLDKTHTNFFLIYIIAYFKINTKKINPKTFNFNKTDEEIFELLRKNKPYNIEDVVAEKYTNINSKKTDTMIDMIYPTKCKRKNILDVGTEDADFLYKIEYKTGGTAYGINIETGFEHIPFNRSHPRFKFYDGKKIPFEDKKFLVVSATSVLHHVEHLEEFISELCRVSSDYVYIKDVDITSKFRQNIYILQHKLFSGGITGKSGSSYNNLNITFKLVAEYFMKNRFLVAKKRMLENFNGTYYCLFQRF